MDDKTWEFISEALTGMQAKWGIVWEESVGGHYSPVAEAYWEIEQQLGTALEMLAGGGGIVYSFIYDLNFGQDDDSIDGVVVDTHAKLRALIEANE